MGVERESENEETQIKLSFSTEVNKTSSPVWFGSTQLVLLAEGEELLQ